MSDNYIKIKELVKNYGSFRALDKISLDLNAGEYVSLLGPNGAGKTTLFQILTGLFVADEGDVEINQYNIKNDAVAALAQIGVVFQQLTLDMDISVIENLHFHANLHGISKKEFSQMKNTSYL